MLDTKKIMKQIERNTKKFLNEFQMFGEEENQEPVETEVETDVETKTEPEPKPEMNQQPKPEKKPDVTPETDVEQPVESDNEEQNQDNQETEKGMSLSNDHKERLNKWLLSNKKLTNQSFEGLVNQMEVKESEAYRYIFQVAKEYLQKTIEKATK